MRKIKSKIITLFLCATIAFSAVGFSACTNSDLEAKLAELETQIAQFQEQNQDLQANIAEQQEQIAHLEQEKIKTQNQIKDFEAQIDNIDEENTVFNPEDYPEETYVLHISASKTTAYQDEEIYINLTLYNARGLIMYAYSLFNPHIPNVELKNEYIQPESPGYNYYDAENCVIKKYKLSDYYELDAGTYELTCDLNFYMKFYSDINSFGEQVYVESNTITITILERA